MTVVAYDGSKSYQGNTTITGFTVVEGVTKIGYEDFAGCTGLTTLTGIPESVIFIGKKAFEGCTGLTTLEDVEEKELPNLLKNKVSDNLHLYKLLSLDFHAIGKQDLEAFLESYHLEATSSPLCKEKYGASPLHFICANAKVTKEALEWLVEKDSSFGPEASRKYTLLHFASENLSAQSETLKVVIDADPKQLLAKNDKEETPCVVPPG